MSRALNFMKTAGIYFIGSVLSKLISFFLLPLYTEYLDPTVLGEYDYCVTLVSFLAPICFFQIWDAMFRFSFDYDTRDDKQKIVNNSFAFSGLGIIVFIGIFMLVNLFANFSYMWIALVYGIFVAINYLYSYLARVYQKNALFVASGFINSLVCAISNIIMILKFNMGLESLYISAILGAFLQCVIVAISLKPLRHFTFADCNLLLIRKMIKFSLPLCIATVSYWLLSGYTKVIIVNKLGTYENGLYAVVNKFASILNTAVAVFQYAWNEAAYMSSHDDDKIIFYSKASKYIMQFIFAAAGLLIIVTKILFPLMVSSDYNSALIYVPISIISVALNSIAGFLGTIFSSEKKTKYILFTTIVASLINIISCIILTKYFGLYGALAALALAFLILMIGRTLCLNSALHINIRLIDFWPIVFCLIAWIVFYFDSFIIQIAYVVIVLVVEFFINKQLIINIINWIRGKVMR